MFAIFLRSIFFLFLFFFFFFNDTATTEIYTLSLHDALPILKASIIFRTTLVTCSLLVSLQPVSSRLDRKSTRLNSSHTVISYAVFCLKKKKKKKKQKQQHNRKEQNT